MVFFIYSWFLFIVSISFFIVLFSLSSFWLSVGSFGILITILLNSISNHWLASISFSSFSESSIPFDWKFFFCLLISGDTFCLFPWFPILCFASFLCWVKFYGRNSVGLSGVVSLISLDGCSRAALSSICEYLGFTCGWPLCWWVLSFSGFTGVPNFHLILSVIRG